VTAVIGAVIAAGLAFSVIMTVMGFQPPKPISEFRADRTTQPRFFADPAEQVAGAYREAVTRTPGMHIAEFGPRALYIDSRPTARILSGDFGVVLLVRFDDRDGGTFVHTAVQNKGWGSTKVSTLRELERALRMRAKAHGIRECV
jgi:hypothetical protein